MFNNHDVTADQLMKLLAEKHKDSVCVPECKTGQSWGGDFRRIDMWVLKKSWSPLTITGYEIKVSRQDFLNDQKWQEYMDYCHAFYFVCPLGLIHPDELPKEVGLMVGSKNLKKLVTKRKAVRSDPDPVKLNQLMSYILMSRVPKIVDNMYKIPEYQETRTDQVKLYLREAEDRKELAQMVKGHIRETYRESKERFRKAEQLLQQVEDFTQRLKNLGIEWDYEDNDWRETRRVQDMVSDLRKGLTLQEVRSLKMLGGEMQKTADELSRKYYGEPPK